jgi:hypothetical protein
MKLFSKEKIQKTLYHFSSTDGNVDRGGASVRMEVQTGAIF